MVYLASGTDSENEDDAAASGSAPPSPASSDASVSSVAPSGSPTGSQVSNAVSRSPSKSPGSNSASRSPSKSPASRSPSKSPNVSRSVSRSPAGSLASGSPVGSRSGSAERGSRSRSPSVGSNESEKEEEKEEGMSAVRRSRLSSGSKSPGGSRSRSESPAVDLESKSRRNSESDASVPRSRHGSSDNGSSSGSEIGRKKRKITHASDSESEKEMQIDEEGERVGREDIFGDDLSISSEDEGDKEGKKGVIDDDDDDDRVQRYDDDAEMEKEDEEQEEKEKSEKVVQEEEDEEPIPETRIDVEVPKITTDLGKELHFVKLPNFLSVDCRPFDPDTYEDEIEDEDSLDEEGRARLKLKVENTIRWRQSFDNEGNSVRESNARVVRWSDGSMSLHLGGEIFDVYKQPLQGDFNHLFIRQGTGLQGQAVFRTKLSFRPHSTESFTHQKLTRNMADRTNKATGIKVISQVGRDPEINRYKRVKEEEERLRAAMKRDSKQKRVRDRAGMRGLSSNFLEDGGDSDEDEEISLAAIKNKFKKGRKDNKPIYSSEDEDSDIELSKAKRLEHAKTKNPIKESDEESDSSKAGDKAESDAESKRSLRSPSRSVSRSRSPTKSRSRSVSRSSKSASRSPSRSVSGSPPASAKHAASDSDSD